MKNGGSHTKKETSYKTVLPFLQCLEVQILVGLVGFFCFGLFIFQSDLILSVLWWVG